MESDTVYTWLFFGIVFSVVSKLLQYQGKKIAGNIAVIPAAVCLLVALMLSVTDFARLYGRVTSQALSLIGIAVLVIIALQMLIIGYNREPPRKLNWLIPILIIGIGTFFWLWQRWV